MSGTGKYEPFVWQIVKDRLGYDSVHETNEDGGPGDIVCDVYGDHASLIEAAPALRKALMGLLVIAGTPTTERQEAVFAEARAAIARSQP